jgi:hypothetical protein
LISSEDAGYDTAISACIIECARPITKILTEVNMPDEWVDEQTKGVLQKTAIVILF